MRIALAMVQADYRAATPPAKPNRSLFQDPFTAVYWIKRCPNPRQATLSGFYDFMSANNSKKAFSLVTVCKPSWLPPS